ncbi:hypothetical protein GGR56DRAFT_655771 [Xylariaceae sp. FL0804]|nr:hypothetical protein GGR56DRAFT_655771 [Xylariaceae sp. FL0804]
MQLVVLLIAFLGLYPHESSSAPVDSSPPYGEIGPWKVTAMSTYSPTGRPGESTLASISATITNPNQIKAGQSPSGVDAAFPPSTASCVVQWDYSTQSPYNNVSACTTTVVASNGTTAGTGTTSTSWTFEPTQAGGGWVTEDVILNFTLAYATTDGVGGNQQYSKVLKGSGHFKVGDNMEGACAASGFCDWGLVPADAPYLIQPALFACEGIC